MVKLRLVRLGAKNRPFYRIVAIDEKTRGPRHPIVARDLFDLSHAYKKLGRKAESTQLRQRAGAIQQAAQSADHPFYGEGKAKFRQSMMEAMYDDDAFAVAFFEHLERAEEIRSG